MGKPFIHIPAVGTASNAALWGCSPCLQHCCGTAASPSSTLRLEMLSEGFFKSKGNLIALYRSDSHNKQLCCHVPAVASCLLSAAPASFCSARDPAAAWCLLQTFTSSLNTLCSFWLCTKSRSTALCFHAECGSARRCCLAFSPRSSSCLQCALTSQNADWGGVVFCVLGT